MAEFKFVDSEHTFTMPIRKFKANDPYYFEVDNIPLAQLEENDAWLKDQLGGVSIGGVKRQDFDELRPFALGADQMVRVNPGKFIARINDAYGKEMLSDPDFIPAAGTLYNGFYFGEGGTYFTVAQVQLLLQKTFTKLQNGILNNSLFLNGLLDKLLQYTVDNVSFGDNAGLTPTQIVNPSSIVTDQEYLDSNVVPALDRNFVPLFTNLAQTYTSDLLLLLPALAVEFSKRWAGVARTALVDIPNELKVPIPAFNPADFYYIDSEGNSQTIDGATGATRIDLVFIYSKAVDTSAATILDKTGKATINEARLGVVVGAGLAVDFSTSATDDLQTGRVTLTKAGRTSTIAGFGDAYMLPSVGDSYNTGGGFSTEDGSKIYGSIPSPDDIMNRAPLLLNDLQSNDYRLIGQSVLPIAYVVRKMNNVIVGVDDVVDIRPFFRTTELTYNERAGIAAAAPALSVANPVVGKKELSKHFAQFKQAVVDPLGVPGNIALLDNFPRTLGGGIIWGGMNYGPEGAITNAWGNDSWLAEAHGVATSGQIPLNPLWDFATWGAQVGPPMVGQSRNDWINVKFAFNQGSNNDLDFEDGSTNMDMGDLNTDESDYNFISTAMGDDGLEGNLKTSLGAPFYMYYVKKKINIALPPGFSEYGVRTNLLNCIPVADTGVEQGRQAVQSAHINGIWVEKHTTYFVVYVSFAGPDPFIDTTTQGLLAKKLNFNVDTGFIFPFSTPTARDSKWFRSFAVAQYDLPTTTFETGIGNITAGKIIENSVENVDPGALNSPPVDSIGVCTYPTVQFEVIGYPLGFSNFDKLGTNLGNSDGNSFVNLS